MKEEKFRIGDRVVGIETETSDRRTEGETGVIVHVSSHDLAVVFDKNIRGHGFVDQHFADKCEYGHGWWVSFSDVRKIERTDTHSLDYILGV